MSSTTGEVSSATTTATLQSSPEGLVRRGSHANLNGFANTLRPLQPLEPLASQRIKKKYRHIAAVHAGPRTSCLSHDSAIAPSFLGFRNLMVIVIVVSQLRLMLENFKKVCRVLKFERMEANCFSMGI